MRTNLQNLLIHMSLFHFLDYYSRNIFFFVFVAACCCRSALLCFLSMLFSLIHWSNGVCYNILFSILLSSVSGPVSMCDSGRTVVAVVCHLLFGSLIMTYNY